MICTYIIILILLASNFITPPQNMSVTKGSNVTISCGHVIASPRPVTWIINGTSFDQEYIFFSQIYQQNRQAAPTENSLTVFSINHTTTFQCVIHLNPTTTSTLGTISVFGMYVYIRMHTYIHAYSCMYVCLYVHTYVCTYVTRFAKMCIVHTCTFSILKIHINCYDY